MLKEIISAYNEAREYDDLHLFDDHIGWLKKGYEEEWFEFPDDYDFDSNRWTIGLMLAQVERYGGIVMETNKGILPVVDFPDGGNPFYQDKDGDLSNLHVKRVGKKINEYLYDGDLDGFEVWLKNWNPHNEETKKPKTPDERASELRQIISRIQKQIEREKKESE